MPAMDMGFMCSRAISEELQVAYTAVKFVTVLVVSTRSNVLRSMRRASFRLRQQSRVISMTNTEAKANLLAVRLPLHIAGPRFVRSHGGRDKMNNVTTSQE